MTESLRSSSLIYLSDNMIGIYTIYRFYIGLMGQGGSLGIFVRQGGSLGVFVRQGGSLRVSWELMQYRRGKGGALGLYRIFMRADRARGRPCAGLI